MIWEVFLRQIRHSDEEDKRTIWRRQEGGDMTEKTLKSSDENNKNIIKRGYL